jgi:hypothetical protein
MADSEIVTVSAPVADRPPAKAFSPVKLGFAESMEAAGLSPAPCAVFGGRP